MSAVLVTGGAGFIGSHLSERLLSDGHRVTVLDNFHTSRADNLAALEGHERFALREGDVTEPLSAVDFGPLQRIYHLACPASPVHYQHDPVRTVRTNVQGMINALELAKATGARLLQASTSEVYGDPEVDPQPESYRGNVNPIGPRSCYDEGKRCAETLCFDYHRQHGVAIKVARIFNTYGPCMRPDDGRVVSNFITQALAGEALTLFGDGRQTRSFCHVSDMVEGLVRLMESEAGFTGPCNLGNPEEVTVAALAERIGALAADRAGSRPPAPVYRPLPEDDPLQRRPDISLARERLGWAPAIDLDTGLAGTVAWFAAHTAALQAAL